MKKEKQNWQSRMQRAIQHQEDELREFSYSQFYDDPLTGTPYLDFDRVIRFRP
jgi:hypothetical protein